MMIVLVVVVVIVGVIDPNPFRHRRRCPIVVDTLRSVAFVRRSGDIGVFGATFPGHPPPLLGNGFVVVVVAAAARLTTTTTVGPAAAPPRILRRGIHNRRRGTFAVIASSNRGATIDSVVKGIRGLAFGLRGMIVGVVVVVVVVVLRPLLSLLLLLLLLLHHQRGRRFPKRTTSGCHAVVSVVVVWV